jgi:hypothetical protein
MSITQLVNPPKQQIDVEDPNVILAAEALGDMARLSTKGNTTFGGRKMLLKKNYTIFSSAHHIILHLIVNAQLTLTHTTTTIVFKRIDF